MPEDRPHRGAADDPASLDDAVAVEQARLLLQNPADVPITLINSALVCAVVRPLFPLWVLVLWFGLMAGVGLTRAAMRYRFGRATGGAETSKTWVRRFRVNALLAGCAWGCAASVILVATDPVYYVFIVFVLGGSMAGGIVCVAADEPAMLAYSLPTVLPAIAALAIRGGLVPVEMALMLWLFTCALVWTGRNINRSIAENVRLRVGQDALVIDLRSSEAAMARAQAIAQVGSWSHDLQSRRVVWSRETYRIFGVDPDTFIPNFQTMLARVHPDDREAVGEGYAEILRTGTSPGIDHRLVMDDGTIKHVHELSSTSYDAEGRAVRINGTVQDVTERKHAENKIQFANVLLKTQMEASLDGIMVVDPKRSIVLSNERLADIWRLRPADLVRATIDSVLLEAAPLFPDPERFIARVHHLFDHPEESPHEEYGLTDGRTIDRDVATLSGVGGEYLGRVWYFRDITERRKADDKLAFANVLLRTQMEASLDGILIVDEHRAIVSFNQHFADIWNIPPADLEAGSEEGVFATIASCLKDNRDFIARVRDLDEHPGADSHDEFQAIDGRSIEGHTVTLYGPSRAYLGRAWFFRDITKRKQAEALALRMARFDVLTGLANRAVFVEALERAIATAKRGEKRFAVLYLDLDHFKDVNDTLGHPMGDELLKAVADRLRANTRETDTVARFGGDEFAMVAAGLGDPAEAAGLADKLLEAFGVPFSVQGTEIHTGVSIGIAGYGAGDPDPETLLSRADVALYRAKSEGRCGYRFFTGAMDSEVKMRVALGAELRIAVEKGQLFLVYQPQVALDDGRITGVEALARWRHPHRGVLEASLFIPIAEQIGIIGKLGRWVLYEACRQGKAWLDAGIAPARICVNVSALQFRAPLALQTDIAGALAQSGLPARMLELELTESALMDGSREHSDLLQRLRATGVTVAIDDFGTGYSSLDYLRRFPSDRIKIAQTFVANLETTPSDAALVRATIGFARELEIDLIAEGVETRVQCELLRDWGCAEVQGYYFARPLSVEEAAAVLRAGSIVPAPPLALGA